MKELSLLHKIGIGATAVIAGIAGSANNAYATPFSEIDAPTFVGEGETFIVNYRLNNDTANTDAFEWFFSSNSNLDLNPGLTGDGLPPEEDFFNVPMDPNHNDVFYIPEFGVDADYYSNRITS